MLECNIQGPRLRTAELARDTTLATSEFGRIVGTQKAHIEFSLPCFLEKLRPTMPLFPILGLHVDCPSLITFPELLNEWKLARDLLLETESIEGDHTGCIGTLSSSNR